MQKMQLPKNNLLTSNLVLFGVIVIVSGTGKIPKVIAGPACWWF